MGKIEFKKINAHHEVFWFYQFVFISIILTLFGVDANLFINISVFFAIIIAFNTVVEIINFLIGLYCGKN
jgi:hypothetical protein